MVKHTVFQFQFVLPALVAEVKVQHRVGISRFLTVDMHSHIIEEHFWRHGANGIRACGIWCCSFDHTITQFLCPRQIEVTPWAGFCLIPHLLQRIRFQFTRSLVIGIGKYDFAHDLSHPAVMTLAVIRLRFLQNAVCSAHIFHEFLR
ncbi:hypothetical protein D3C75_988620 [compost metagenome]